MGAKIIVFCGSPRKKGNTNRLVNRFKSSAEGAGATVDLIDVCSLETKEKGCIACMGCQKSDEYACVIQDQAQPVLASIPQYDVMVMATPVYWFAPAAQLKSVTDRAFCLIKMDPDTREYSHVMQGKTLALIATAGREFDCGLNCVDLTYKSAAKFLDMTYQSFLVPHAPVIPARIERDSQLMEKIKSFGEKLAE